MVQMHYALVATCRGQAAVIGSDRGIARFVWPQRSAARARAIVARVAPEGVEVDAERLPSGLARSLADYFAGRPADFADCPLDLSAAPPFFARVLTALRAVRYGRTTTYGELARRVGRPGAARAVGAAMAANPLPVIVPCHRVLRGDGRLGGFSAAGGVRLKRELLEMESAAGRNVK